MDYLVDVELSDRELLAIGKIVALWGRIEYEIFCQTLMSFEATSDSHLPSEMNNMNFSLVLALWEVRIVSKAEGRRKEVLEEQSRQIHHYHEFRNALVHGMWSWGSDAPEKITATRVRKKEVVNASFTVADLESFASELGRINFSVRFPNGINEFAGSIAAQGSFASRRWVSMMTSSPVAVDLFAPFLRES